MLNRFKIAVIFISIGVSHLLAPSTTLYAQYLDTVHVTDTQYEYTVAYDWSHTYLTSFSEMRDSNIVYFGWSYLQFKQYDDNFNIIRETRHLDSLNIYTGRKIAYHQSAYYFSGFKFNFITDTVKSVLVKFDSIGNVIWEKTYFPNDKDVRLASVTSRPDGKIIILGNNINQAQPQLGFTFVSLLDTSGSVIWTKTYNQVYSQQPISYKNTAVGGGILATTHQINNTNYQRTAIYKLDANGNTQWQKILGYQAPFQGPTVESVVAVSEMPDGNFLCYGGKSDYQSGLQRSWLVKLSPNGTVLKDTVYDFFESYDVFNPDLIPIFKDDGFYMGGDYFEDFDVNYSNFNYSFFDYDLNLIWSKEYKKRQNFNHIYFNKQLENGFIALAGFVFKDNPTNTADEWFMVLDSMGCETEICANSLGIQPTLSPSSSLLLYPNPAQDEVYLSIDDVHYNNLNYTIIDISGKVVLRGTTQMRNAVDISKLPNGYYVMQIVVEDSTISKSLIISR
jgi:hypothetical protein